ncbi:MAG: hypothetical protein Q8O39_01890 [bacterium]|nr:hypothetical protein [bacterium]
MAKKLKNNLQLVFTVVFLFVVFSAAIPLTPISAGNTVIDNPLSYSTFEELISHILDFVTILALIIVPLIIVYAAFLYMASEGDPNKVKTAQAMIFYAIIGLILVLLSRAIISIIHGILS